jgi:hypothetical protein
MDGIERFEVVEGQATGSVGGTADQERGWWHMGGRTARCAAEGSG